ncbi:transposase family protein [Streptomyces sp. NPDC048001]|uniref:transposase family protein n=1 Tax=Streptomyces sp. NPDC048001 TaxID=3365498 RepID=UPI00370F8202
MVFVLALAACAVLAGAKSLAAIAEWTADAPPVVLAAPGGRVREPTGPTTPAEATIRRVLQRIDGDALDTAIGAWLATRAWSAAGRPTRTQPQASAARWPWTARPCAVPDAPTARRSICSPR